MHSRLPLHEALVEALGSNHVYFQPPEEVKIEYPAIVYSLQSRRDVKANNKTYLHHEGYMVTVIDEDADSEIPGKISELDYSSFNRFYIADNLNHWVFIVYVNKEN